MEKAGMIKKIKKLDYGAILKRISSSLRAYMLKNKRRTAVVGISGGVDSAVAAAICARAVGKENVLGLILPSPATGKRDMADALSVVSKLGIGSATIDLRGALREIKGRIEKHRKMTRMEEGNLMARLRMAVLYSFAHSEEGLVIGTGNKSELALAYYTKYGDGGCDILPIGDLYKTQVKELARYMRLPGRIVEKPPSPGFWPGHTAEEEMGATYGQIDTVLWCISHKWKKGRIAKLVGPSVLNNVLSMMKEGAHKGRTPKTIHI